MWFQWLYIVLTVRCFTFQWSRYLWVSFFITVFAYQLWGIRNFVPILSIRLAITLVRYDPFIIILDWFAITVYVVLEINYAYFVSECNRNDTCRSLCFHLPPRNNSIRGLGQLHPFPTQNHWKMLKEASNEHW